MVSESSCEANKIYRRYPRLQNKFLLFFIILFIFQHEHNLPDVRVLNKYVDTRFMRISLGKRKLSRNRFRLTKSDPGTDFLTKKGSK